MAILRLLFCLLSALLPQRVKILCLRWMGAEIGTGCRIGISVLDAKHLRLGEHVSIGHFNLIHRLQALDMGKGSKIGSFNWITGGTTGCLKLGNNSSIRRLHFLEASASIVIGKNSIIAGRSSLLFTHGLSPSNLDDLRPITIGDWCYIGAACRFLPGSSIGDGTFVGMGAVVAKKHADTYVLLAGNPAQVRRRFTADSVYFRRPFIRHSNHPETYDGT